MLEVIEPETKRPFPDCGKVTVTSWEPGSCNSRSCGAISDILLNVNSQGCLTFLYNNG